MYSKKTKFVSFLLSFVMIFTIVNLQPQNSYAESYSKSGILGGRFRWKIDSNKTFTIQGNGYISELDFDDESYDIYRAIGEAEKVIIGEGIKNIPNGFLCETEMKSLILPDSLEEIGANGINSYYLKSLHIPKNVHKLGTNAIMCPNLKQFTVASDSQYFTTVAGVLYNKNKTILVRYPPAMDLTTFYIPDNVYKIATGAFYDCRLYRIIMPDTVEQMGHYAFSCSENLTYIKLSSNLEGVSGAAFSCCYNLQSIELPDSVEYITGEAFDSCECLSYVKMSKNINEIGDNAFYGCSKLKNLDLPNGLKTIGRSTFSYSGLRKINIPDTVNYLGDRVFSYCENLKDVSLSNNLKSIPPYTFNNCSALTYVYIPDCVTEVKVGAFINCKNLVSVRLPEGMGKIEANTFSSCEKLSNINLPNSIKEIDQHAFVSTALKNVRLPQSLIVIGDSAFRDCKNLESIFIPKSVSTIGNYAFYNAWIKNVQYDGTTEEWNGISIGSNNYELTNAYEGCTITFYVNNGSSEIYSTQIISCDEYIRAPEKPVRSGYVFTGWYSNPNCNGEPYIATTGVSYRKPIGNISLYAGWKATDLIEWGIDTFKFGNINYFWGNEYKISDEYYNILTKDLGAYDKYCMRIQKNKDFGGSCYGMSVTMAMFKQGLMTPHFVQNGAENVHELSYPKNDIRVASLINYYQLSQSLPSINKKINNQSKLGTKYLSKELVNALLNIKNTGIPVVLGYEFKDGWKWYKHAVLAYKVEEEGLYYKVHIADPNNLAHSDQNASSFIIVEDTEPSYMYIDNDWSNVSYKGAEGTHSFKDNTLKLFCVLSDNSLYQSINIQEKLTNQCMGQSNYTLMRLSSLNEVEPVSHLNVNFEEFSVVNNSESAVISKDGISGNLEISDGTANYGDDYVSYELPYSQEYTVIPCDKEDDNYEATIIFENDSATYMSAKSEKNAKFDFSNNSAVKVVSDTKCEKSVLYSSQSDEWLLGGIDIAANVETLELEILENGKYQVKASSSLKGAIVSIIDLDGNKTSIDISDDVLEFIFTYSQSEEKYVVLFEGTNNDEVVSKTNTVVFFTNGGSSVNSISDIEYGNTIVEPEHPIYEGFIFDGWYLDEELTTKWDFENDVVTENMILYAKWEEDASYYHIVSFNDGTSISQIVVPNGYVLNESDLPKLPTEDGYYYAWDISTESITADTEIMLTKKPVETMFDITYVSVDYDNRTANITVQYETSLSENLTAKLKIEDENNTEIASYSNTVLYSESETSFVVPLDEKGKIYTYNLVCCDIDGNELVKYSGKLYAEKEVLTTDEYIYSVVDDEVAIISYVGNNQIVTIPTEIDGKIVSTILSEAFSSAQITEIIISESITDIESNAFGNCTNLSKIKVSESNSAYCSQDGILYSKDKKELIQYTPAKSETSFTVPNFVERIGNGAFYGSILNTIILSTSTVDVSYETFAGCANLENIEVSGDSTTYSSVNGVLFDKTATELILYPSGRTTDYYFVPDGTKCIKSGAFCNGEITYLAIPSSLEMFEEQCFNEFWFVYILYCGDENSWNNIAIGANEDSEYWDIRYNYNPDFRIDAEIKSAVDDGKVVSLELNYNYSYQPHSLYAAIYDEDGRLIDLKNDIFYEWDEPGNLSFDFEYGENVVPYKIKVFFFESINTIKPLRTAIEAVITRNIE